MAIRVLTDGTPGRELQRADSVTLGKEDGQVGLSEAVYLTFPQHPGVLQWLFLLHEDHLLPVISII